ncbi:ORF6C domain-containing protein [Streptococcus anginosus]|uniref:ORF6C domain-containing protein n=1 Tax=Streptococcus anginosus TaxID=1328 RepID=UPI00300FB8CD
MNEIFNFHGQEVRTVTINEEPWFVANDVAIVLGYSNQRDALSKHVDDEDKITLTSQNATLENIPNRGLSAINESGLYSLILSSKLPQAKEFKRWVTSVVLPQIRQQGAYVPENLTDEAFIALFTGQKQLKAKQQELVQDVAYLKSEQPIHPSFAQALQKKRKARVVMWLGGKESPAYGDKLFAASVFREAEQDFKEHFNVNRYDMLPKKFESAALSYWMNWEPSTNTKMKIRDLNAIEKA